MGRNRASGWRYAKLSGHENESDVKKLFQNPDFCREFSSRLGIACVKKAVVGGLNEKSVNSLLGDKTKSKSDLQLLLEDGCSVNISIKKSWGGQVYLIGVSRFIEGFEKQFSLTIPEEIREMLHLYFYGHSQTEQLLGDSNVIQGQSPRLIQYQKRHNRLIWKSLLNKDKAQAERFLDWLKNHIEFIADFCFSKGLASESDSWVDYVWYINLLGDDDVDVILSVESIKRAVKANLDCVVPSRINGGSTIYLPFGFVQWHQQKMQFHHKLDKLLRIIPPEEQF